MSNGSIDDLVELMRRLRDPHDGCPWDRKQTYASIVPHTLEEAYEVADSIERGDWDHLQEELGDLLFQVVFYARLGEEEGRFDFDAIARAMVAKLVRRHPHVFPAGTLDSRRGDAEAPDDARVKRDWEAIKAEEKAAGGEADEPAPGALADVPHALPALSRAAKLQKRAARVGFDWPQAAQALAKVGEEAEELREAHEGPEADAEAVEDELGDLLFAAVNVARHWGLDPEAALRRSNRKFERRFAEVERRVKAQGLDWGQTELAHLDSLWDAAKAAERSAGEGGTGTD